MFRCASVMFRFCSSSNCWPPLLLAMRLLRTNTSLLQPVTTVAWPTTTTTLNLNDFHETITPNNTYWTCAYELGRIPNNKAIEFQSLSSTNSAQQIGLWSMFVRIAHKSVGNPLEIRWESVGNPLGIRWGSVGIRWNPLQILKLVIADLS